MTKKKPTTKENANDQQYASGSQANPESLQVGPVCLSCKLALPTSAMGLVLVATIPTSALGCILVVKLPTSK